MFKPFQGTNRHLVDFAKPELDDLELYCRFVLQHVPVIAYSPYCNCVSALSGHSTSLILHRDPPYQAQLIIKYPNSIIPEHSHPNVDSIEVYIGGQMHAGVDGVFVSPEHSVCESHSHPLKVAASRGKAIRIYPGQLHGGVIGSSGGAFLSVQKWLNEVPPSFVQFDWSGPTLNGDHYAAVTSGSPSH